MAERAAVDTPPVYRCTKCERKVLVEFEKDTVWVTITRGVCFKWCREPVYIPANSTTFDANRK